MQHLGEDLQVRWLKLRIKLKEKFGIKVESYTVEKFIEKVNEISENDKKIEKIIEEIKKKATKLLNIDDNDIKRALKFYVALDRLIKENGQWKISLKGELPKND